MKPCARLTCVLVAASVFTTGAARAEVPPGAATEHPAALDPSRAYTLDELIDLAESSHPVARVYWERAVQAARRLGVAQSEYFPLLVASAAIADERIIEPFPRSIVPVGYTTFAVAELTPQIALSYLVLDFGGRSGRVDAAKAAKIGATAQLVRENQQVAFHVATAFYALVTQEEGLEASKQTLATAKVTLEAAEAQLSNGRATMPDVLDARAAAAQAVFDLQSATGAETLAHIALTEAVGAEPSPNVTIARPTDSGLPGAVAFSIDQLLDQAGRDRPDLQASIAAVRQQDAAAREAKSAYFPTVSVEAQAGRTWEWPQQDAGGLGAGSAWTWGAGLTVRWTAFDGGARGNRLEAARSKERELRSGLRDVHDHVVSEVWSAHVQFLTALRKQEAAVSLLDAATASYGASLDAYRLGVKTIVDVVTAQRVLATARLARVSARSDLLLEAVALELVTGNLLRGRPALTRPAAPGGTPPWPAR